MHPSLEILRLLRERLVLAQFRRKFHADMAAFAFRLAVLKALSRENLITHSWEDQPRWPSGMREGGRWRPVEMIRPFGGKKPAAVPHKPVPATAKPSSHVKPSSSGKERIGDLPEKPHEIVTPHTESRHVNVSKEAQARRILDSQSNSGVYAITRNGSFGSFEEALQWTKEALKANRTELEKIARGKGERFEIFHRVGTVTGREAYLTEQRTIDFRPTYGVTVVAEKSAESPLGYVVIKSFPSNR